MTGGRSACLEASAGSPADALNPLTARALQPAAPQDHAEL